jgi:hypothetical protein
MVKKPVSIPAIPKKFGVISNILLKNRRINCYQRCIPSSLVGGNPSIPSKIIECELPLQQIHETLRQSLTKP